jgi:hypothetical protein
VDPQLKAALAILEKAEREWKPPPGPIVLTKDGPYKLKGVRAPRG